ncbi:hypothetical protein D3C71_1239310 [compost metagenome]
MKHGIQRGKEPFHDRLVGRVLDWRPTNADAQIHHPAFKRRADELQPVVDNDFVALAVDVSEFWAVWKEGSHPRFRPVGPLEALDH